MGVLRNRIRPGMMDAEAARVVDEAAAAWVKESKARAPVRTGNLRDKIERRQRGTGGRSATVVSGADYSNHVKDGTRYMAGNDFWTPGRRAAADVVKRAKLRPKV